jgi:dTMP kinase
VKGYFITFEGGDGSGKTTILAHLAETLADMGYNVLTTREPGGIKIAEKIREIILNPFHTEMDARTEALLYAAARRQHLTEKVLPALEAGKVVLCDRFIDSSLAYQGYARGIGMENVYEINQFAIQDMMPDLTLLFDITPEKGLERIAKNKDREKNRLDLEQIHFHEQVYQAYNMLREKYAGRIQTINADQKIEAVETEALNRIISFLNNPQK